MIDFKDKQAAGYSTLIVVAILALVSTLGVMLLVPKSTAKGLVSQERKKTFEIKLAKDKAADRLVELKKSIDDRVWAGTAQEIGPAALAKVGSTAAAHKIKVIAFRPQRVNDSDDLTQYPFLVTLDGQYLSVLEFIKDIQQKDSKLAINLVQFASSDGASDRVTASIGLMAYQKVMPAAVETKKDVKGVAMQHG